MDLYLAGIITSSVFFSSSLLKTQLEKARSAAAEKVNDKDDLYSGSVPDAGGDIEFTDSQGRLHKAR